jgi:hypothetical protein
VQGLETTNSSTQIWLGNVSFEIDTLPEEDSAPADGKYPDLLAHTSVACGEIEESCLLICHFYLPKERADTYRHKNPIGQVSFS